MKGWHERLALNGYRLEGPFAHENPTFFLIAGEERACAGAYVTLEEALKKRPEKRENLNARTVAVTRDAERSTLLETFDAARDQPARPIAKALPGFGRGRPAPDLVARDGIDPVGAGLETQPGVLDAADKVEREARALQPRERDRGGP